MSANETVLPGERLRRAREEKGLSQEEACKHLRLSTSYMRALEQDDYERLPEAPFIKGYLRNYARFLGLPAEELARQFQQRVDEMRQDEREREQAALDEAPSNREWRLPALAVLVVVLLVAVGWWLWPRDDMSAPEPSVDDGGRGGEETFDSPAPPQAPEPASQSAISPASAWAPGCSARNTAGAAGAPFSVIGSQRSRPAARCSPSSSPSPGSRYGTRSSLTASSTRPSGMNQHTSWPLCAKAAAVTDAQSVSPNTSIRMASPCSHRLTERALWERAPPAKGRPRRPAGYQRRLKKRI